MDIRRTVPKRWDPSTPLRSARDDAARHLYLNTFQVFFEISAQGFVAQREIDIGPQPADFGASIVINAVLYLAGVNRSFTHQRPISVHQPYFAVSPRF